MKTIFIYVFKKTCFLLFFLNQTINHFANTNIKKEKKRKKKLENSKEKNSCEKCLILL